MQKGKANIIIDGQWGSTGKGKLAGYLATHNDVDAAVCDFMPNAGHTFVGANGDKFVTCQLPTSVVNKDCLIMMNAASAIDLDRLFMEIEEHGVQDRLMIHPHAAIVTHEDKEYEAQVLKKISSTLKGCGGCTARKVMRIAKTAKDEPRLERWIGDTTDACKTILLSGGTVLLEGAQGFDLSINHGYQYPYVTSRDVTTMSILNNAGIPPVWLGDVYGCLRTFPIRVGNMFENNVQIGTSGPWYGDQREITWDELKTMSGADYDLVEKTTVTQKIRRVFTFSNRQLERFIYTCAPNKLFINFINHIDAKDKGSRSVVELSRQSIEWLTGINEILSRINMQARWRVDTVIKYVGSGAGNNDMIEI
jgi:adenylosuccinate synthase